MYEQNSAETGSRYLRGIDKVRVADRQHFSPHLSCQAGPVDHTAYKYDAKVHVQGRPSRGYGGREGHPEGELGQGHQDLDDQLDYHIRSAGKVSGDCSNYRAQNNNNENADDPNRERNPSSKNHTRQQVPASLIGSKQEDHAILDSKKMHIALDQPEHRVLIASHEEPQRMDSAGIFLVDEA